jgi:hypothetical protein
MASKQWKLSEGVELAKKVENIAPLFGAHVALTGGLLYKDGPRKDCDLIIYRAGDTPTKKAVEKIDRDALIEALRDAGLVFVRNFTRVAKFTWGGKAVDFIFPESAGEYPPPEQSTDDLR